MKRTRLDWSHISECQDCHRSDGLCDDHRPRLRPDWKDVALMLAAAGWLWGWIYAASSHLVAR